jgi:hypothetical protein
MTRLPSSSLINTVFNREDLMLGKETCVVVIKWENQNARRKNLENAEN